MIELCIVAIALEFVAIVVACAEIEFCDDTIAEAWFVTCAESEDSAVF